MGYTLEEIAKLAYHAYAGVTDWKNFQGNPMPQFDALPEKIQQAWIAAVKAAREYGANDPQPNRTED